MLARYRWAIAGLWALLGAVLWAVLHVGAIDFNGRMLEPILALWGILSAFGIIRYVILVFSLPELPVESRNMRKAAGVADFAAGFFGFSTYGLLKMSAGFLEDKLLDAKIKRYELELTRRWRGFWVEISLATVILIALGWHLGNR